MYKNNLVTSKNNKKSNIKNPSKKYEDHYPRKTKN